MGEEKKESSSHGGATAAHHVYIIQNLNHGLVPARLIALNKDKQEATVAVDEYQDENVMLTSTGGSDKDIVASNSLVVELSDYDGGVLPLQNTSEWGDLLDYEDMVDLPYLHEVCLTFSYVMLSCVVMCAECNIWVFMKQNVLSCFGQFSNFPFLFHNGCQYLHNNRQPTTYKT